jgi:hypothetical protein
VLQVPTDPANAVCLYKYAVNAIPNFFYFLFPTIFGYYILAGICRSSDIEGGWMLCIVFCVAAATAVCAFISASFLTYYIFAGFFIGAWFQFGSMNFSMQFFIPEGLSIIIFFIGDVLSYFDENENRYTVPPHNNNNQPIDNFYAVNNNVPELQNNNNNNNRRIELVPNPTMKNACRV